MADQKKDIGESESQGNSSTGDPGRTPGTAEGDRQTVEDDLRQKERDGQSSEK